MEIMDKGYMVIPVILFVVGIIVSATLGGMGAEIVRKNSEK